METYSFSAPLRFSQETVFNWYRRQGALTRITPHWAGSIGSDRPLGTGVLVGGRLALPGSHGLAGLPWQSEIIEVHPGGFTDVMVKGPFTKWKHTHELLAQGQGTLMQDTFEVQTLTDAAQKKLGPARKFAGGVEKRILEKHLESFFQARCERLEADLAFWERYPVSRPLVVVVAGASGLVGRQVCALLSSGGHLVRTLVRREPQAAHEYRWNPESGLVDSAAFEGADAVIHLGGVSINRRFTERNKGLIFESRQRSTALLAEALAHPPVGVSSWPGTLVVASALGIYGAKRPGEVLVEDSSSGDDFLARVCRAWEAAADPAREAGLRVVHVRTGLVQSVLGGALRLQLPAFLAGAGAWLGSGEQAQSWISLDDIAGVFVHAALTPGLQGAVNAVAPQPVSARELAQTVGRVLNRPVLVGAPVKAAALLLGREGAEQLAGADQWASCEKLVESGYRFFDRELLVALKRELG